VAIIVIESIIYNNYFLLDFFIFMHSPNHSNISGWSYGHCLVNITTWMLSCGHFFVDIVKLDNSLKYILSTLEKSVKIYSFDMDEMYLKYYVLLSLTYSWNNILTFNIQVKKKKSEYFLSIHFCIATCNVFWYRVASCLFYLACILNPIFSLTITFFSHIYIQIYSKPHIY
jgi:hypothetical protein